MKAPLVVLLLVATLAPAASSDAKPKGAKPSASSDVTRLSEEELIARFQREPRARIMEDESADVNTFVAEPPPDGHWVDLIGTSLPRVSSTMRELTRRGLASIPALLDHLTDARPTKVILAGGATPDSLCIQYLGSQYDGRRQGANEVPPGVDGINKSEPGRGVERFKIYRLKVGDLCYAALGQIVNRRLIGLRNFVGFMYGFNSPVRNPALAAAARADWGGLTDDGFREFLIGDVESLKKPSPDLPPRNLAALKRLLFYYRADGVALAVKLLDQPLVDTVAANACYQRLIDADDEAEQDRLLADFRAQRSPDEYQYLAHSLVDYAAYSLYLADGNTHPWALDAKRSHENAVKIVNRCFTEAERNPTFVESQFDCMSRQDVIETMRIYPSAEIDTVVRRLLQRVFALRMEGLQGKEDQRELAMAGAKRLLPPTCYNAFEKASLAVYRRWSSATQHEEKVPAYVRANDEFLQKLAAEPALQPPAGQP